jgi:hypothetical protein
MSLTLNVAGMPSPERTSDLMQLARREMFLAFVEVTETPKLYEMTVTVTLNRPPKGFLKIPVFLSAGHRPMSPDVKGAPKPRIHLMSFHLNLETQQDPHLFLQ